MSASAAEVAAALAALGPVPDTAPPVPPPAATAQPPAAAQPTTPPSAAAQVPAVEPSGPAAEPAAQTAVPEPVAPPAPEPVAQASAAAPAAAPEPPAPEPEPPVAATPAAAAPPAATASPAAAAPPAATATPVAPAPAAPSTRRVRLVFARDALERALSFLEQSDYGGLVTHVFAIRTLVPTVMVGLDGEVPGKLAAAREALQGVVNRLFIKMRMPRYAITAKDLEDRMSRSALIELVQALRDAGPAEDFGGTGAVVLEGPIDVDRITRHLEALVAEPLGTARPWLVLAELLPSRFITPASGEALNAYRSALISTFTNVTALPSEEFHRVLGGTHNAALDAALRDVRMALRDALEATAARA